MFQIFLDRMAERDPDKLHILIEDNGAFHKAKKLKIPENVLLIFQPSYSPEVNGAEKMWAAYKRQFTNKVHKTLEEVSTFIQDFTQNLTPQMVMKTTRFEYILPCLN